MDTLRLPIFSSSFFLIYAFRAINPLNKAVCVSVYAQFCLTLYGPTHCSLAPLSTEFSRQEYQNGWPLPTPGDLPNPGIEPASLVSPALAGGFFTTSTTWEAQMIAYKFRCGIFSSCYSSTHRLFRNILLIFQTCRNFLATNISLLPISSLFPLWLIWYKFLLENFSDLLYGSALWASLVA